jgi:hypothetical protein
MWAHFVFFSLEVVCAHCEPTFIVIVLKHVANHILNYGQFFRMAPFGFYFFSFLFLNCNLGHTL